MTPFRYFICFKTRISRTAFKNFNRVVRQISGIIRERRIAAVAVIWTMKQAMAPLYVYQGP